MYIVYIFVYVYICIYINIYIYRRANGIYIQKSCSIWTVCPCLVKLGCLSYITTQNFQSNDIFSGFCGSVARGGRARVLPAWCPGARFKLLELGAHFRLPGSTLQVVREHARGCPGAHFRVPGSTFQVAREHTSGCPGAHFRLPGSTLQDAWEHTSGCPGAHFRLPGSTFQVAREHT